MPSAELFATERVGEVGGVHLGWSVSQVVNVDGEGPVDIVWVNPLAEPCAIWSPTGRDFTVHEIGFVPEPGFTAPARHEFGVA